MSNLHAKLARLHQTLTSVVLMLVRRLYTFANSHQEKAAPRWGAPYLAKIAVRMLCPIRMRTIRSDLFRPVRFFQSTAQNDEAIVKSAHVLNAVVVQASH